MSDGYEAPDNEPALESLRGDGGPGPMPPSMRASVRDAFVRRRTDSVFADVHDDGLDSSHSGLRDGANALGAPRLIRLGTPDVEIQLEITALDGQRDIVGRIGPTDASTVEIRCPYRVTRHEIDSDGAFVVRGVPKGPLSLLFHGRDTTPVTTRWIVI